MATLLITALASAAAAYATSKIWAPGTLASAAFTPVIVAVLKEALDRPARVVTQAVPVRGVVRSAPTRADVEPHEPALERVAQQGEISYHSSAPSVSTRRWRLAIVTGLLGFVVAALVFTVPEIVSGGSAAGGGRSTTLFGGQAHRTQAPPTTTAPSQTVTVQTRTVLVPAQGGTTTTAPPGPVTPTPAPANAATTPAPAPAAPAPTTTIPPVVP